MSRSQTAPPSTSGWSGLLSVLIPVGWAVLVPIGAVAAYVGIALAVGPFTENPLLGTLVAAAATTAAVVVLRRWRPSWFAFAPSRPRPSTTPHLWLALAGLAVLAFLAGQAASKWAYLAQGSPGFEASAEVRQAAGVAVTALLTLVLAPVGEEALFRGLVYPLLRRRIGIVVSTTITAAVFGLVHANVVQFVAILPLAVLVALAYERTRTLLPCVLMHVGFNLAAVFVPTGFLALLAEPLAAGSLLVAFAASVALFTIRVVVPAAEERTGA